MGRFERSFRLPTQVSADDIEAEARHGVLTIKVMKAKEAQPHRVTDHHFSRACCRAV